MGYNRSPPAESGNCRLLLRPVSPTICPCSAPPRSSPPSLPQPGRPLLPRRQRLPTRTRRLPEARGSLRPKRRQGQDPADPQGSSGRRSMARPGRHTPGRGLAGSSCPRRGLSRPGPAPHRDPGPRPAPWPRSLTLSGLRAGLGRPLRRGRHGHTAAPTAGAASSGPRHARARPAPGARRSARSPRPWGAATAGVRCAGIAGTRLQERDECGGVKRVRGYFAPEVTGSEAEPRAPGLCSMPLRCQCAHFPLPTATGASLLELRQNSYTARPVQGLRPARPSQAHSPVLCLRMFSFGLADPLTSAGLNAI